MLLPEYSLSTLNVIHHMDALSLLRGLADASVDLVVTSPPYNLAMRSAGGKWNPELRNGYDTHGDDMPHADYVKWQRHVLDECMRVIKPNSAIFYNHKWRIQGGVIDMHHDITQGFPVRQVIIWRRPGGMNFNAGYFVPSFEVIYLIAKSEFKLTAGANGFTDVWNITAENDNRHPAPFPVQLAERCIVSTDAQVILDPFIGSGTTAVAAQKLGRHYIGAEISPAYVRMARERLSQPFMLPLFQEATP